MAGLGDTDGTRAAEPALVSDGPPLRQLADFFAVLADPSRLATLMLLQEHGEMCVCDIQEVLGFSQSRASRHLQMLRLAGLVQDRRVGVWAHYRIVQHPRPRQKAVLTLLPKLIDPEALAEIEQKLAAWRGRKATDPCALARLEHRKGHRR